MKEKNKSIEEIKARYSLSCDGWIPVEADDWSHLVNSYDELLKENKRMRDALVTISNMCIGEIAMGYSLDAQYVGELIYSATGMTNQELNERSKGE